MRITSLIFCIIIFYSCGTHESKETAIKTRIDSVKTDTTSMTAECIQRDTTTSMGTKIHYLYRNGRFQISWGDNLYNRIYDSLYSCDYNQNRGLWDFVPKYNSETKNNLIFTNIFWTSSGGNPAPLEYYAIVLPKNKKDTIFEKEFFIDSREDYLVYGDSQNENIHILNLETKKTQLVILNPKPYQSRSPTLSIKKTKIEKNIFHIQYELLDNKDEIKTIVRTFKIEI